MDYYSILEEHVLTIYHDMEFREENVDIEIAIVIKELKESNSEFIFKELEDISYAATVSCNGSYDKVLPEGEAHLAAWIEKNGYKIVVCERAYCTRHPGNEKGSPAYFKGKFSADGNINEGAWVYPGGGGYNSTMSRVK